MKLLKIVARVLFIVMLCVLAVPLATADEHNKKTQVTFMEPVEVPGRILPAGKYTFALMDSLDRSLSGGATGNTLPSTAAASGAY